MPGVNGLELARYFREACPTQPVLLLSGYPIPTQDGDRFVILQKPIGGEDRFGHEIAHVARRRAK